VRKLGSDKIHQPEELLPSEIISTALYRIRAGALDISPALIKATKVISKK
jgi:hypothetical protein